MPCIGRIACRTRGACPAWRADWRTHRLAGLVLLIGLALLGACQTTSGKSSLDVSYNPFFTPADHLEELLAAGDLDTASRLYHQQRDWFAEGSESRRGPARALAQQLYVTFAPMVDRALSDLEAITWPADRESWPIIEVAMGEADLTLADLAQHAILLERDYRADAVARLESTRADLRQRMKSDARAAFLDYPHATAPSFVTAYPIELELATVLDGASWDGRLARYDAAELDAIWRIYAGQLPAGMAGELERALFAQGTPAPNGNGGRALPWESVTLVDLTSRTLARGGAVEFPIGIVAGPSVAAVKSELEDAFGNADAEMIVLIDVASARADRQILRRDEIESEIQVGTREVPNPAYLELETEVAKLAADLRRQQISNARQFAQPCYDRNCELVEITAATAQILAEIRLRDLYDQLTRTPPTLVEPVYRPYRYNRTTIEAVKVATVRYYVIDRRADTWLSDTFDVRESATFTVDYGRDADDRNRGARSDEADVAAFEAAAVEVKLAEILARFARVAPTAQPMPSLDKIQAQILADRNAAIAAHQARSYDAVATAGDTRFESVVVVYHPEGGLGSGFYVASDVVLTNFHVIERAQFLELKLFNGMATTGKVIASDPRLDLALIKVATRGLPVTFFAERSLTLGASVELVGHPDGLEFSITRGVVSALRELDSLTVPGGRKVRFIQSDAAINGGNSGGPMFLDGRVIGVATWKLAAIELEGLSFAIHYGEVLDFLARNGIVPNTGS